MAHIAIIGGSGLTQLNNLKIIRREMKRTPYGEPSAPLIFGTLSGEEVLFLPRHGPGHTIPPHEVNYCANIWALSDSGITHVIAVAAVGIINTELAGNGDLLIPDQIIDYTYGRQHTFFGSQQKAVTHVDFTEPYCERLRESLIASAKEIKLPVAETGTYAATQGPRFESAAEIGRLERDGADIVGMTGMPEAALAKELGLCYATIAVAANPAAGKSTEPIDLKEVNRNLTTGMEKVRTLLAHTITCVAETTN